MSVVPFPSPRPSAYPIHQAADMPRRLAVPKAPWPALWLRRWRGRRMLAALDRDQIRDADLDPFEVRLETLKPFWRA